MITKTTSPDNHVTVYSSPNHAASSPTLSLLNLKSLLRQVAEGGSFRLLGGGSCSTKPKKDESNNHPANQNTSKDIGITDSHPTKAIVIQDKTIQVNAPLPPLSRPMAYVEEEPVISNQAEYTYQMSEEQSVKIKNILRSLTDLPPVGVSADFVIKQYFAMFDTFSAVLSSGLTNPITQKAFNEVLETAVNFLLSLVYQSDLEKRDLFTLPQRTRLLAKLSKLIKLFKKFETRLPLKIAVFLLQFQRKILKLRRKNVLAVPAPSATVYVEPCELVYIQFCFCGFSETELAKLEELTQSLSVYYEFDEKQRFVVDLLKTEADIVKKYRRVTTNEVEFERYYEVILKDNHKKAFSSVAYGYLMLFDQIYDCCVHLLSAQTSPHQQSTNFDFSAHFIRLVSGDTFIQLCEDTFTFSELVAVDTKRKMQSQLKHNMFMRYVELRVMIQTYKLLLVVEEKQQQTLGAAGLRAIFSETECKNIERLKLVIFEKFLLESSIEVNSLIYDDEVMVSLIERVNEQQASTDYFAKLKIKIKPLKESLSCFLIDNLALQQQVTQKKIATAGSEGTNLAGLSTNVIANATIVNQKKENLFKQISKRKDNYSLALRNPQIVLGNRFIEAFINRIASKNDESLHEKGLEIHVNQRLKFLSKNQIQRSEVNVNGFVEDPLRMFESYFLAESNTKVNVVALKGDAGIGKTHMCRQLVRRLIEKIQKTGSRSTAIPIMIEMTEVENIESHRDLEQFLISSIQRTAFRSTNEISYLKNSTIPKVIILDGLSEWAWGSPSLAIRKWIRLREWENTKLIITYRKPFVQFDEFPYFFGQRSKQPGVVVVDGSGAGYDEREFSFEVFKVLPLSQESVEDYVRQKEHDVSAHLGLSILKLHDDSIMTDGEEHAGDTARKYSGSGMKEVREGFLVSALRLCTQQNSHLIEMLESPFNLFCFVEMLAKVPGIQEIYWGGGGTREERRASATWFANQEEMQERLFLEELNGVIQESGVSDMYIPFCLKSCTAFFEALAMGFFVERHFKASLRKIREIVREQKIKMNKGDCEAFEKVLVTLFSNIQRTSFLASSDASFFTFVRTSAAASANRGRLASYDAKSDLASKNVDEAKQRYYFRNTAWLEFMVARAMKSDFDKHGNSLHSKSLAELEKFAVNQRYLLEERTAAEHQPFSISQWTNNASIEMHILQKLASIIRKDLINEEFQAKLQEKDIEKMHRYIQIIQRTRRQSNKIDPAATLNGNLIKQLKHPLDVASSNILSAICYNKLTLQTKLRDCSFSRAYLYGYRGDIDVACSDLSEANLRGSTMFISKSKFLHALLDDEKKNHERWNTFHSYSFASLHFKDNKTLVCGSNHGGVSVFQARPVKQPNPSKQTSAGDIKDWQTVWATQEDSLEFYEMKSHQRSFADEVRGVLTFPSAESTADIFYCFQSIIAHVTEQGEEKELVIAHQNRINAMDICIKRAMLASVSSDGTCRIWGIQTSSTNKKQAPPKTQILLLDEDVQGSCAEMDLLHTLARHEAEVTCVSFSPNGNLLATGSYDSTLLVWDIIGNFEKQALFRVRGDWITCLAFSADSTVLAAGSSMATVKLWDVRSLTFTDTPKDIRIQDIPEHDEENPSRAALIQEISARGTNNNNSPGVGGSSEEESAAASIVGGGVSTVKFSPSMNSKQGKTLVFATFDEPGVVVYEQQQGQTSQPAVFSFKARLHLDYAKATGKGEATQDDLTSYFLVNSLAFSPDGKLIAVASQNQTVCTIWKEVPAGGPSSSTAPYKVCSQISPSRISALALSRDGRLMASAGGKEVPLRDGRRVSIWALGTKSQQAVIVQSLDSKMHESPVTSVCFSPKDEFIASGSSDGQVVVWRSLLLSDGKRKATLDYLAGLLNYHPIRRVSAHSTIVSSLAFSSDGQRLVSCSVDGGSAKVWDASSPTFSFDLLHLIVWREESEEDDEIDVSFKQIEFSSNGDYLATLPAINSSIGRSKQSSCVYTWIAKASLTQQAFSLSSIVGTIKSSEEHSFSTRILTMGFSKDSYFFATGQSNGLCVVWNVSTKFSLVHTIDAHFSAITHLTFSADSQMLATTSLDNTCKLWHVPNRFNPISSFYVPDETTGIEFVRQGHSIAVTAASDEFCMKFYDVFSPSYAFDELRAHSASVNSLSFSLDGRYLLSASSDSTVRVWDLKNSFAQHLTINLNGYISHEQHQYEQHTTEAALQSKGKKGNGELQQKFCQEEEQYLSEWKEELQRKRKKYSAAIEFDVEGEIEGERSKHRQNEEAYNNSGEGEDSDDSQYSIESRQGNKKKSFTVQLAGWKLKKESTKANKNDKKNASKNELKEKKRRFSFSAPFLKPSQKRQKKLDAKKDDEQLNNDNDDDFFSRSRGGIIQAVISSKGAWVFAIPAEDALNVYYFDITRGIDDIRSGTITRKQVQAYKQEDLSCLAITLNDEYLAVGSADRSITVWRNVSHGGIEMQEVKSIAPGRHTKLVSCVAFSANNKYFASGSWDITCKVYDVENDFQLVHNLDGQYGYLLSLAFSPDSQHLAITSRDASTYVWNVDNRLTEVELFDHKQAVTAVSYSQTYMATASKDKSFSIYDRNDGYKLLNRIDKLPDTVNAARLSPDGKYLVIAYPNSIMQVWDLYNMYDLTIELSKDAMFKQILEMEKTLVARCGEKKQEREDRAAVDEVGGGSTTEEDSICNYLLEEEDKQDEQEAKENEELSKQLPAMKNAVIMQVLQATYKQYAALTEINFSFQETHDHRFVVTVPKKPLCILTL